MFFATVIFATKKDNTSVIIKEKKPGKNFHFCYAEMEREEKICEMPLSFGKTIPNSQPF